MPSHGWTGVHTRAGRTCKRRGMLANTSHLALASLQFATPQGIGQDADDHLFIADYGNQRQVPRPLTDGWWIARCHPLWPGWQHIMKPSMLACVHSPMPCAGCRSSLPQGDTLASSARLGAVSVPACACLFAQVLSVRKRTAPWEVCHASAAFAASRPMSRAVPVRAQGALSRLRWGRVTGASHRHTYHDGCILAPIPAYILPSCFALQMSPSSTLSPTHTPLTHPPTHTLTMIDLRMQSGGHCLNF